MLWVFLTKNSKGLLVHITIYYVDLLKIRSYTDDNNRYNNYFLINTFYK